MLKFHSSISSCLKGVQHLSFIGPVDVFKKGLYSKVLDKALWSMIDKELKTAKAGPSGKAFSSYTQDDKIRTVKFVALPEKVSRGNTPTRKEWIYKHSGDLAKHEKSAVILVLDDASHYLAAATAVARHLKLFSDKSTKKKTQKSFHILAIDRKGDAIKASREVVSGAQAVPESCKLVDSPPSLMNPKGMAQATKALFKGNSQVSIKEIAGAKLKTEKLGGVYAVGQAAEEAPRILVLDYKPSQSKGKKTVALVGKGVTYDTGGLSLKISGSMVGMKSDMGGAAAVVGAFKALVDSKVKHRVVAVLGLVENAIGPKAYKNDDIIHMHSGKTVEINNTDAEGRLVLADCVSYVGRKYKPQLIIDAATLTGAQMVATGNLHAGVVSNRDEIEELAKRCGKESGDLVAPLPFAPEFYKGEFASQVADMKNSVANRMNAQSSCAAQFIHNHIEDLDIPWLHIDLAGPSFSNGRGTGYGVALISHLVRSF